MEKNLGQLQVTSQEWFGKVIDQLGVAKDLFDHSTRSMLKKMDLTNEKCFVVIEKIPSMPHLLHMFKGSGNANHLIILHMWGH